MGTGQEDQELHLHSLFWLPGHEDERIPGMMSYRPGVAITVDLFEVPLHSPLWLERRFEVLRGIEHSSDREFMLLTGMKLNSGITIKGRTVQTAKLKFYVVRAIIGLARNREDDIAVTEYIAQSDAWTNWVRRPLWRSHHLGPTRSTAQRVRIRASVPSDLSTNVGQRAIFLGQSISSEDGTSRTSLSATTSLRIACPPTGLFALENETVWPLIHLLAFSTGVATHPSRTTIRSRSASGKIEEGEVLQVMSGSTLTDVDPLQERITFSTLRTRFDSIVKNWLRLGTDFGPVLDNYFACVFGPSAYPSHTFLSLTYALEAFHRRKSSSVLLNDPDAKKLKECMRTCIPSELKSEIRQSLSAKLGFIEELSLRGRLRELKELVPLKGMFLPWPWPAFASKVVDLRNWYAHLPKSGSRFHPIEIADGFKLTTSVMRVVEMLLLRELGITQKAMKETLVRFRTRFGF